jgi:UDP-N-acetyl-D-glucosamine dehydrogenase
VLLKKSLVVGLGYVGLPLALAASTSRQSVVGFDTNEIRVSNLGNAISHVSDVRDSELRDFLSNGSVFKSKLDAGELFDVAVICVPTPLNTQGEPDISYIIAAANLVAKHIHPGSLVILESTSYPGTTEEILIPILEKGSNLLAEKDFFVCYSPERVDPGNPNYNIRNTPKIVGALSSAGRKLANDFYKPFVNEIIFSKGPKEAETAKLLENTYRHINIALVNEMAIFCHELGIDIWDTIRCAETKPFGFKAFFPSSGVGGHCIPIDPSYLAYKFEAGARAKFRFVEVAQEINNKMPEYVADRVARLVQSAGLSRDQNKVVIFGVSYKRDSADTRETPARKVVRSLLGQGFAVSFFDPNVERFEVEGKALEAFQSQTEALKAAHLVVILQPHSAFDYEEISASNLLIFDATNSLESGPMTHVL